MKRFEELGRLKLTYYSQHLPREPVIRNIALSATAFEIMTYAMYIVAVTPTGCESFEYKEWPDGVKSVERYARQAGIDIMYNGHPNGESFLVRHARKG